MIGSPANGIQKLRRDDLKSDEEFWFYLWLVEACKAGYVESFAYEPKAYLLLPNIPVTRVIQQKTKRKTEDAMLIQSHSRDGEGINYTPDYVFTLTPSGVRAFGDNVFWQTCQHQSKMRHTVFADVKGTFNPFGGNNQVFFLKRYLLWSEHGIFCHKITLSRKGSWFKRTWGPTDLRWAKGRRTPTLTKLGNATKSVDEYASSVEWKMHVQGEML